MNVIAKRLALAGLAMVLISATAGAEENVWVADDGAIHDFHGEAIFVSEDGATRFDLADLADGESRTFGVGPRAVTVTRSGNNATIQRGESGPDVSAIEVACSLDSDRCTVLTFAADPEKVMVAIEKQRTCVDGDCDFDVDLVSAEMGDILVEIACDGADCEDMAELHEMHLNGISAGHRVIHLDSADGEEGEPSRIVIKRIGSGGVDLGRSANVFVTGAGGAGTEFHVNHTMGVMLRCPEGDATLTVKKEEAEETFLCPKHSTPLEKVAHDGHGSGGYRVIRRDVSKDK